MKRKEITSIVLLILVLAFGVYRYITAEYEYNESKYLNYTPDEQGKNLRTEIYCVSDSKNVKKVVSEAMNYMQDLVYKFSDTYCESITYELNHSNGKKVAMDKDLYELLDKSKEMYELSEGKFDITIKPVLDLWEFDLVEDPYHGDNAKFIPSDTLISNKLKLVDFSKIVYNKDYIIIPAGMEITFGAISKGFIVDKTVDFMLSKGIKGGYIDQVSSIRYFGELNKRIVLGIQHPRKMGSVIDELTNLNGISIATSGDYQQFFDVGMQRYHHLINAKTGYPCSDNVAITVLSKDALTADALSTSFFMMNAENVIALLDNYPQTEVIYYREKFDSSKRTWNAVSIKSKGIEKYINIEEDIDIRK